MPTKKKKRKPSPQVPVAALLELAEEQLQRGHIEESIGLLRQVQAELKKYQASNLTAGVTIPPHIVAAQAALLPLLAKALFAHSLTVSDLKTKMAEIDEASNIMPEETRYVIARGACHLLSGDIDVAECDFQLACEKSPGDRLAARALALVSPAVQVDLSAAGSIFIKTFSSSLLAGLQGLASGETEAARERLGNLPQLDGNPSRAEAAALATQLFYHGVLQFAGRDFRSSASDFRESLRLARAHAITLPWQKRLAAYFHKIAENVFEQDLPLAIECWRQALSLDQRDETAANNIAIGESFRARAAWRAGETEQAAALWGEALSIKPQDDQLLRSLAIACERLGRKPEAVQRWRALLRLWRQQTKGRHSEAGFKDRLIRLEEHVIKLMFETGSDAQEIANELEAALKLEPENQELRLKTAERLVEIGKPRQALKHLETIEKSQGASVELLVRKAEAFEQLDRHRDASRAFEGALELGPSNPVVRRSYLVFLGQEAMRADEDGDFDLAINICEKQLSIDPNYEPAMVHLAGHYVEQGRIDDVKKLVGKLLDANPQDAQKHIIAGNIYLEGGQKKEAEKLFKKAIELEPGARTYYLIGVTYWEADYDKEALRHFDRASETADFDLLLEIAVNLVETGGTDEAERFLKKAMKIDPSHPIPHMIRAISLINDPIMLLFSKKGLKEAVREFAEAERLMEGRDDFKDVLRDLRKAREFLEKGPSGPGSPFGGLGGFPFPFDDDLPDEGSFFGGPFEPKRRKRK